MIYKRELVNFKLCFTIERERDAVQTKKDKNVTFLLKYYRKIKQTKKKNFPKSYNNIFNIQQLCKTKKKISKLSSKKILLNVVCYYNKRQSRQLYEHVLKMIFKKFKISQNLIFI